MTTARALSKPTFGVPSAEVVDRIGTSDQIAALHAAHYRYGAMLAEIERQFEAKAAELREQYLSEVLGIHGGSDGAS